MHPETETPAPDVCPRGSLAGGSTGRRVEPVACPAARFRKGPVQLEQVAALEGRTS